VLTDYLKDDLKDKILLFIENGEFLLISGEYQELIGTTESIIEISKELEYKKICLSFSLLLDIFMILYEKNEEIDDTVLDLLLITVDTLKSDFYEDIINLKFENIELETFSLQEAKSLSIRINREKVENLNILQLTKKNLDIFKYLNLKFFKDLKTDTKIDLVLAPVDKKIITAIKSKLSVPIIVLVEKNEKIDDIKDDIKYFLSSDIYLEDFDREIVQIVNFEKQKFMENALKKEIESLQPLGKTMQELQSLPSDSSLRDISSIVMQDVVLSAKIIKLINSPFYGLQKDVTSVNQAITLLGKEKTLSIATISCISGSLPIDISSYGISENTFLEVGFKRMKLVLNWVSKIDFGHLSLVSTAAMIGGIGKIILSKQIKKNLMEDNFKKLLKIDRVFAENQLLHCSSEELTATILRYWGFNSELIDSIYYSNNILEAPNDVKHLSIINYVTYQTFDLSGNLNDKKICHLKEFLREMNFDVSLYEKALSKIDN
jgi:HD-like signal output (HDOD) protein